VGRADHGSHARQPRLADEVLAPLGDEQGDVLPERPAVRQCEVLDLPAFVRRLDETEEPGALAPAGPEERLERVAAEVGADGHRVRERRFALQIRGRVRARGGTDVAPLRVGDHQQPGRAGIGADLLERAHAVRAERLEERELRLDRDCVGRDGVDDAAAEARTRRGGAVTPLVGVAGELDRKQLGQRVEADHQLRALALDRLRQPITEEGHLESRNRVDLLNHQRSSLATTPAEDGHRDRHPTTRWLAARVFTELCSSSPKVRSTFGESRPRGPGPF
jgi:hypothetical protein